MEKPLMVSGSAFFDGKQRPGMKVLAIIPARGGSKRIPYKNIREFHGQPMLHYSLKTAEDSKLFAHIHVSTDDDQIAQVAKDAGYPVKFKRDERLADDQTGVVAVLKNDLAVFEEQGERYDAVVMILACAPLLLPGDLTGAMDLYLQHGGKNPVMTVCKFPVPPEWAFEMSSDGVLTPADPEAI
ncbi:MAG TPA: acylneuraminate cytidylyltransferase family protein, partial [Magnetovibrio sp.]